MLFSCIHLMRWRERKTGEKRRTLKTNAERQRLYQQRRDADPSRREGYLQAEQARYTMWKTLEKRKQMFDQSDKQSKITGTQWKRYQQSSRQGKQEVRTVLAAIRTFPTTPSQTVSPENRWERGRKQVRRDQARKELKMIWITLERKEKRISKAESFGTFDRNTSSQNPRESGRLLLTPSLVLS